MNFAEFLKMIIAITILVILIFTPADRVYVPLEGLRNWLRQRDAVAQGELLYRWIDSFGPGQSSFDLSQPLPCVTGYPPFGQLIHNLWRMVQRRGGRLSELLRPVKLLLREDLKRARRQRQVLKSAYFQLIFMVGLVWCYLGTFSLLMEVEFEMALVLSLMGWQLLGVFVFRFCLGILKKWHFDPFLESLEMLLQLNVIAEGGELGKAYLKENENGYSPRDHQDFKERLRAALSQWQGQGFAQRESLKPLGEDLMLLASDNTEHFLEKLKMMTFLWAITFVLPPLFAGSLFGLYKLAVV
jgi:hypothetical protein